MGVHACVCVCVCLCVRVCAWVCVIGSGYGCACVRMHIWISYYDVCIYLCVFREIGWLNRRSL